MNRAWNKTSGEKAGMGLLFVGDGLCGALGGEEFYSLLSEEKEAFWEEFGERVAIYGPSQMHSILHSVS